MSAPQRVQQQPAYILHHRPFRDSSQILDVLTRDHGKIALVARGSRGAKSKLRGVLRPFLPLHVSWVARSDLGTLTGAESAGLPVDLRGDATLSAYYMNELLINFLHRHDPQAEIFELYAETLAALGRQDTVAGVLRRFEIELLGLLGYALSMEHELLSAIRAQQFEDPEVLRAAGRLLREVISYHLGGKELKSRKVLLELHRGRIARPDQRKQSSE